MASHYVQAIALRDERFHVLAPYFRDLRVYEVQDILKAGKFFDLIAKEDRLLMHLFLSTVVFPEGTTDLVSQTISSLPKASPDRTAQVSHAAAPGAPTKTTKTTPMTATTPKNQQSEVAPPKEEPWTEVTRRKPTGRRLVVIGSEEDIGYEYHPHNRKQGKH